MISKSTLGILTTAVLSSLVAPNGGTLEGAGPPQPGVEAVGTFAPAGPPLAKPVRVEAGGSCVVDLIQPYEISGTLAGALEIDYRILVHGPCEVPPVPGRYGEEWIARGVFSGTIDTRQGACTFTYTATVRAGGEVAGVIVLGGGLDGQLVVTGSFEDGRLSYRGRVTRSDEGSGDAGS